MPGGVVWIVGPVPAPPPEDAPPQEASVITVSVTANRARNRGCCANRFRVRNSGMPIAAKMPDETSQPRRIGRRYPTVVVLLMVSDVGDGMVEERLTVAGLKTQVA